MATFAARPSTKPAPRKPTGRSEPTKQSTAEVQIPGGDIAERAFEKFMARGCVHGFDQQDWFDAEDELRAEFRERE